MSELSFLIELLLNHDLPKATKDLLASRIRDVEANLVAAPQPRQPVVTAINGVYQAPSTIAAMARHGDLTAPTISIAANAPSIPVEQVAQTPAAAAAINSRNEAINNAISGKVEKGRVSPRKF